MLGESGRAGETAVTATPEIKYSCMHSFIHSTSHQFQNMLIMRLVYEISKIPG